MSKHKKNRNSDELNLSSEAAFTREKMEVARLLERGNTKSAVEIAKGLHKRVNSADSEAVLVDAYAARLASLREHDMVLEADALEKLVRERYPTAAAKLDGFVAAAKVTESPGEESLDDLVRPLCDPAISREERLRIEGDLRKRLVDPAALRNCVALPAEHPLRTGAAAVDEAFQAVTRGPVSEEQVVLAEISHRSPLAPWKALVRALAGFYANDDASCERHLQTIGPESPAARAVPAMRELLNGRSDRPLNPAEQALCEQVGGLETMRSALQSLDTMLAAGKKGKPVLLAIEKAIAACKEAAPDLVVRLRQRIWVHSRVVDMDVFRVNAALGGQPLLDAWFWLLFARSVENPKEPSDIIACSLWAQFLLHAVHEGWFPRKGPEVASLYLHMGDLLERIPPYEMEDMYRELRHFPGYRPMYDGQPREIREALSGWDPSDRYFAYPQELYKLACAIDPRPEGFQRWLEWARRDQHWKPADQVAEAWRRALPNDVRPLLYLMLSASERDALQKAIGYAEEAERIDPLNPEVRSARLRFLTRGLLRHFQERKPRLAERKLQMLFTLPQAQEGSRPAVVSALRWVSYRLDRDERGSAQEIAKASSLLESEAVAWFLFGTVGVLSGLSEAERNIPPERLYRGQESKAAVVARGSTIAADFGITVGIPPEWILEVKREVSEDKTLDVPQLRALAGSAVRFGQSELAYAISAAGLARGGLTEARFLLVRARALPPWEIERRRNCISAAAELARRNRDMALVNEAVELRRSEFGGFLFDMLDSPQDRVLDDQQLSKILKQERAAASFPTSKAPLLPPFPPWMEGFEDDDEFLDEEDDDLFDSPEFELFARELEADARRAQLPFPKRSRRKRPF